MALKGARVEEKEFAGEASKMCSCESKEWHEKKAKCEKARMCGAEWSGLHYIRRGGEKIKEGVVGGWILGL